MAAQGEWDAKYPHDWLVWDANATGAPFEPEQLRVTQLPDPGGPHAAGRTEGLCFALPVGGAVHVGRSLENDIVIPDATVSRQHLLLERTATHWTAIALPSTRVTKFNLQHATLAEDGPIQLTSGDRITLGGVKLTYLDAKGMRALVELEANSFSRP